MSHEFSEGDVVRLKSGGPAMTIEFVNADGRVPRAMCIWFDGSTTKSGEFLLSSLEPSGPDS